MKASLPILRVTPRTTKLIVSLADVCGRTVFPFNCDRIHPMQLSIVRSGCIPNPPAPARRWCGCCYEVDEPPPPQPVETYLYDVFEISNDGNAVFYLDQNFLSAKDGRYDASLCWCGRWVGDFQLQLDGRVRHSGLQTEDGDWPDCDVGPAIAPALPLPTAPPANDCPNDIPFSLESIWKRDQPTPTPPVPTPTPTPPAPTPPTPTPTPPPPTPVNQPVHISTGGGNGGKLEAWRQEGTPLQMVLVATGSLPITWAFADGANPGNLFELVPDTERTVILQQRTRLAVGEYPVTVVAMNPNPSQDTLTVVTSVIAKVEPPAPTPTPVPGNPAKITSGSGLPLYAEVEQGKPLVIPLTATGDGPLSWAILDVTGTLSQYATFNTNVGASVNLYLTNNPRPPVGTYVAKIFLRNAMPSEDTLDLYVVVKEAVVQPPVPTPPPTPPTPTPTPPTPTPTPPTPTPTPPTPTPTPPTPTPTPPPAVEPFGFPSGTFGELLFRDEFTGTGSGLNDKGLDTRVWGTREPWWGDSDRGRADNYIVEGGELKIWLTQNADGSVERSGRAINTGSTVYFKYGFYEVSAIIPKGMGPWPSFWLYNYEYVRGANPQQPEIDFMEAYPGGGLASWWSTNDLLPINYAGTLWDTPSRGEEGSYKLRDTVAPDGINLNADFHRYQGLWDSTGVTFYFDGQALGPKIPTPSGFNNDTMTLLIAMGAGSASGTPTKADFDAGRALAGKVNSYRVQYVRVWNLKNGGASVRWPGGNPLGPLSPTPAPTPPAPTPPTPPVPTPTPPAPTPPAPTPPTPTPTPPPAAEAEITGVTAQAPGNTYVPPGYSGPWGYNRNVFAPGPLTASDYTLRQWRSTTLAWPAGFRFEWAFPNISPTPYTFCWGYPALTWGRGPWGPIWGTTGHPDPMKTSEIGEFKITVDIAFTGANNADVLIDIYTLPDLAFDGDSTNEISILLSHDGVGPLSWLGAQATSITTFPGALGECAIYKQPTSTQIMVMPKTGNARRAVLTGQIDAGAVIAHLISIGQVDPNAWISGFEFGVETQRPNNYNSAPFSGTLKWNTAPTVVWVKAAGDPYALSVGQQAVVAGAVGSPIAGLTSGTWADTVRHQYSKVGAWNCDSSRLFLLNRDGTPAIVFLNGRTFAPQNITPFACNEFRWHRTNPDLIYGVSGNQLFRRNIVTGAQTVLLTVPGFLTIAIGPGEGNISDDGRWIMLGAGNSSWPDPPTAVILYDIEGNVATTVDTGFGYIDWASVSPSGDYIVVNGGTTIAEPDRTKVFSRASMALLSTWSEFGRPSHYDMTYTATGAEIAVGVAKSGAGASRLIARRLDTGVVTELSTQNFDWHTSARNVANRALGVVGCEEVPASFPTKGILVNLETKVQETIIPDFGFVPPDDYWNQPQPCLSTDGKHVIWASTSGGRVVPIIRRIR